VIPSARNCRSPVVLSLFHHQGRLELQQNVATGDEARRCIRDAVHGFLESSAGMGTFDKIRQEARYEQAENRILLITRKKQW
jgi:hypothetical protein